MGTRYCPRCRAEVEDAGGYCLLGHPLRLEAPVESLSALRAEVDRAFEDARIEVSAAVAATALPTPAEAATPMATPAAPSPPPAPARPDPFAALRGENCASGPDPMAQFAPAPRMDWGPERHGLLRRRP